MRPAIERCQVCGCPWRQPSPSWPRGSAARSRATPKAIFRSPWSTQVTRLPAPNGDGLPARSLRSQAPSLSRLEQCRETRNLLLQIVAQLGSRHEEIQICFSTVHRILVREDDQSNILTRGVAQRSLHDEFSDGI